jgi:hypothetical protein
MFFDGSRDWTKKAGRYFIPIIVIKKLIPFSFFSFNKLDLDLALSSHLKDKVKYF